MLPARTFSACFAAIVVAALTVSAQSQQPPTFSTANRTVAVYATVTEPSGRLVTDLEKEKFEITDNGKRQDLTIFANDLQPITIVILLDRSGSMRSNFKRVEAAAEEFVRDMLPEDKARIGSFSNRIQVDPQEFTSSHEELIGILQNDLQEEGPTPLWNAVNVGITALLHQQGRRVVLVFTDGVDRPMNFSNNNSSLKSVMKRAEEENVMVYAIGFSGENGPPGGGSRSPMGGSHGGGFGRPGGFGMPGGGFGGAQYPRRCGRGSGSGVEGHLGGHRRRVLRAHVDRQHWHDVQARRNGAAPSVRARLHAHPARRQDAFADREGRRIGDDGPRTSQLPGREGTIVRHHCHRRARADC